MDVMEEAGINVIIGTPTYAVPAWMVKAHPDVIATTKKGAGIYGARQIMDITNPVYLFYAERVIRKLMELSAHRKCVIGFQIDNETKYYGTAGKNVQLAFVKYLREKFHDDLDAMNHEFGLDYWSNRVDAWEDFPDVRGTINGSLGAEFEKFQRTLVDKFLSWQAGIVSEYKREDQFITNNLDFEWRGYSYGVQPVSYTHLDQPGVLYEHCTEFIFTENMRERKHLLESRSDATIVVPGGIGTYEEFFEILTLKSLGRIDRPIVLYNIQGYYDSMRALLEYTAGEKFMSRDVVSMCRFMKDPEEILDYIENYRNYGGKL